MLCYFYSGSAAIAQCESSSLTELQNPLTLTCKHAETRQTLTVGLWQAGDIWS